MSKGENTTGWIKLHRQTADHGHFQMPDICFKLWVYCLLKAQPVSQDEQSAGTLLLSYGEIQDNLRQPGRVFSKSTISAALRYLQERGYLLADRTPRGLRITVQNWQKYQEDQLAETASNSGEETPEVQLPSTPAVPEANLVGTVAVLQTTPSSTATVPTEKLNGVLAVSQNSAGTPTVPMEHCPGTVAVHQEPGGTLTVPSQHSTSTLGVPQESNGTLTVLREQHKSTPTVPAEFPKNDLNNDQERKDRGLKDRGITPQTPLEEGKPVTVNEVVAQFSRYNSMQQTTIQQYWQDIGRNRKGDNLSIASIREYMNQWEHYPVELVLEAMELHLERYPDKRVSYTGGIMRRLAAEQSMKPSQYTGGDRDRQARSSLDAHPIYGAPSRFAHLLR